MWDGVQVATGWQEGMNLNSIAHIWPLTKWFQPGPVAFTPYSGRFADDDQLGIQADVEWLAERGIVTGCAERHFCPDQWVSREQAATFLARAFELPPSTQDFFVDDTGSPHEASINAIASAGFAPGCTSEAFCPQVLVSRQELAGMLSPFLELTPSQTRWFGDFTGALGDPWGAVTRQEIVKVLRLSLRAIALPAWNPQKSWPS